LLRTGYATAQLTDSGFWVITREKGMFSGPRYDLSAKKYAEQKAKQVTTT